MGGRASAAPFPVSLPSFSLTSNASATSFHALFSLTTAWPPRSATAAARRASEAGTPPTVNPGRGAARPSASQNAA